MFLAMNTNWSSGAFVFRKDVVNSIFKYVLSDKIKYGSSTCIFITF